MEPLWTIEVLLEVYAYCTAMCSGDKIWRDSLGNSVATGDEDEARG